MAGEGKALSSSDLTREQSHTSPFKGAAMGQWGGAFSAPMWSQAFLGRQVTKKMPWRMPAALWNLAILGIFPFRATQRRPTCVLPPALS